jgi:membrane protein
MRAQNLPPAMRAGREAMTARSAGQLIKGAFHEFHDDNAPQLSAALAYYTIFSIAPLLIVVLAVAGFILGEQAAQGRLMETLQSVVGEKTAAMLEEMLAALRRNRAGVVATALGALTIIVGAFSISGQLRNSLNEIWDVRQKPDLSWGAIIKSRLRTFLMVLVAGLVFITSLVASAVASRIGGSLIQYLPGDSAVLWQVVEFAASFVILTCVFAILFKYLPSVEMNWSDIWVGAAVTGFFFAVGKFLIGLYIGRSGVTSAYGAAGSLAVLLLWIYYSALIFFLGAEFTQVYARQFGHGVTPSDDAEFVGEATRREGRAGASARATSQETTGKYDERKRQTAG